MKKKLTEFHRENILKGAKAMFLKYGFLGTTMEMIARESEYSKPTIYAYFNSKEQLFAFNLLEEMKEFKDRLFEQLKKEVGLLEKYLLCCHEVVFLKERAEVFFEGIMGKVSYSESLDEGLRKDIREVSTKINDGLRSLFVQGVGEGKLIEGIDMDFAYDYVWSCIFGILSSARLKRENYQSEEKYHEALSKCFSAVLCAYVK